MTTCVSSTEAFIHEVFRTKKDDAIEVFYRGHSDKDEYKLKPFLFRNDAYLENEDRLFRELLVLNPGDFAGDLSTLDKLVRMQHHSLPTRLLDITSNPLMALYFACKSNGGKAAEVLVFKIKREDIKFYDSDTASAIANLAKLSSDYKSEIDTSLRKEEFNKTHPIPMLHHFIKEEKPYFLPIIEPSDMNSVICVRTKFSNMRIASQVGASLIFGLNASLPEEGNANIGIERILIDGTKKRTLIRQLDALNINQSTVFPYIENSAKYLASKYRRRIARRIAG